LAPFTTLAYLLALGNLLRVAFVLSFALNPEKIALMGMAENGKLLKVICGLQIVLGGVIAGCTYLSSQDEGYLAYAADLASSEPDFGNYLYFAYVFCGIGVLGRLPQVINVRAGMARFMANGEAGLPSDKGKMTTLEFTFGFTAVNFLLTWAFVIVMVSYAPTVVPIAGFLTLVSLIFIFVMARTILDAGELGFGVPQLLFFLVLISLMFGTSLLTLIDYYF